MEEPRARAVNKYKENYDVYIGRGSIWGNPFILGKDGDRDAVISQYRLWLSEQKHLVSKASELAGKRLGCFCSPQPCHGDTLAHIAHIAPQDRIAWLLSGEDPSTQRREDEEPNLFSDISF